MPTKREMQVELERLRDRLRENNALLRAAAIRAAELMALQDKYEAMKAELAEIKRNNGNNHRSKV